MSKKIFFVLFIITLLVPTLSSAANDMLDGMIASQIKDALPWDRSNVEVDEITVSRLAEAGKYDDVRVRVPLGMAKLGKTTFPVSFFRNGVEVKSLWATARIRAYKQAVVALKPLKSNRMIKSGEVKLSKVDVQETQDSFVSVSDVAGMVVKRPIRAGEVIKKTYVKPERLVKRGDRVDVSVEGETLMIRSRGTATEDGFMGREIAVRTASGREINGTVVGPGKVVVDF